MCLQGAAFDLPEASAEKMLEQAGELIQRKFTLDRPSSLPLQEERGGSVSSLCIMIVLTKILTAAQVCIWFDMQLKFLHSAECKKQDIACQVVTYLAHACCPSLH
jgi:hypothetical protein